MLNVNNSSPHMRVKSALKNNFTDDTQEKVKRKQKQYFFLNTVGGKERPRFVTEPNDSDLTQSTRFLSSNKTNIFNTPSEKFDQDKPPLAKGGRAFISSGFKNFSHSSCSVNDGAAVLTENDESKPRAYLSQVASPCLSRAIETVKAEAKPRVGHFEKAYKRIGSAKKMNELEDKLRTLFSSDTQFASVLKSSIHKHNNLEKLISRYNFSANFIEKRKAKKGAMENLDKFSDNFKKHELVKESLNISKKKKRDEIIRRMSPPCYYKSDFLDFHFANKNPDLRGTKTDLKGIQEIFKKNQKKIGGFFETYKPPDISINQYDDLFIEGAIKETYDTTRRYYHFIEDPKRIEENKQMSLLKNLDKELESKKQIFKMKQAMQKDEIRKKKKFTEFT